VKKFKTTVTNPHSAPKDKSISNVQKSKYRKEHSPYQVKI